MDYQIYGYSEPPDGMIFTLLDTSAVEQVKLVSITMECESDNNRHGGEEGMWN